MTTYQLFQVDAFSEQLFGGNPAGVVLNADTLSDRQMQQIARELNNSETAFVLAPDSTDHDCRIRYFTPTTEVPSCGHATIAAHYVRATVLGLKPGRYWHKIGIGRLPVDLVQTDSRLMVQMTQGKPEFGEPIKGSLRERILEALGLNPADIVPDLPVMWVNTGNSKILIPVRSRSILNGITPVPEAILAVDPERPSAGLFVFTLEDPDPDVIAHCRMFAPQIGIPEDPVTGNGNGPLGAYLVKHGVLSVVNGSVSFQSRQGERMGRPGTAHVRIDVVNGEPETVCVGGSATIAFTAELNL